MTLATEEHAVPGVRPVALRLYRPLADGSLPALLYLHGGGFTSGSLDEADAAAAAIARSVPALVLSVGYSLAPSHPFPAAVEDAHRAAVWLAERAEALGVRPGPVGIAAHEAGGHVALSLLFAICDRGGPGVAALALLGPMLDPSLTRTGDERKLKSDLSVAACARFYRAYLPDAASRVHPYAMPLDSLRLDRMPPTLVLTAERDVLRPEAECLASRLIAAGVPTEATRFPGLSHAALAGHPPALRAVSDFLRRRLAGAAPRTNPDQTSESQDAS
ncbi:alpha/beta hydrolase [Azospirillum sp. SYSU D00513]|uniref:alpha/beta hydrolase n=1 Tax=Azospirillum sp. SYSU D00513 TaxID=2812561 RepID=UPI001A959A98|nr:alpha/beta hydrolase [Azospirillum sp. SYSU D00513]